MFHTQNKIGLMCNLVEFTWVTGVEGAVWVEYAHPTPLGRREGHGSYGHLRWEYLVFQMMLAWNFISKYHQGKDNMKTRTKTNLLCVFMVFSRIELHPNHIYCTWTCFILWRLLHLNLWPQRLTAYWCSWGQLEDKVVFLWIWSGPKVGVVCWIKELFAAKVTGSTQRYCYTYD